MDQGKAESKLDLIILDFTPTWNYHEIFKSTNQFL